MADVEDGIDWTLTTWEGNRREQLRRHLHLSVRERLRALSDASEFMRRLADRHRPRIEVASAGSAAPLPACSGEDLLRLDTPGLIELMVREEDRVPRVVIDACAQRGEEMISALRARLDEGLAWDGEVDGEWWLALHAAMILGLIPSEAAGDALVELLCEIAEEPDDNLQDWLSGWWPALFANKPDSVFAALRKVARNRHRDTFTRVEAAEAVVSGAELHGSEALEGALAWLAGIVEDSREEWDHRLAVACVLLDYPRPQYRGLLERLADRHGVAGRYFSSDDVLEAYGKHPRAPQWHSWRDPWRFYEPAAILERQERWAREDEEGEDPELYAPEPYIRDTPKVGRNDSCPCGSGKKYKKCCLGKDGS